MDRSAPQLSLLEAARIVARGGDLDSELAALTDHVRSASGALAAAIYLLNPVAGRLVLAAASGIDEKAFDSTPTIDGNDDRDLVAAVARDRRPTTEGPLPSVFDSLSPAPRGVIALPLIAADASGAEDTEGVLVAAFAGEAPDPTAAEDPLFALADLCAVAIRKARLANALIERSEWIERLASTDALTGIANRSTFERMLELEIARARRQELPLSVVIFDVDGFGEINEREGHAAGDDILRQLAALLADQIRLVDTVGRVGGDEFGVIAPGGGGAVVAKRVREAAASSIRTRAGAPIRVRAATVVFPQDGDSTAELMAAASDALAAPSQNGRHPLN